MPSPERLSSTDCRYPFNRWFFLPRHCSISSFDGRQICGTHPSLAYNHRDFYEFTSGVTMHHFLDKREGGTASQADWSAPHPYAECFQVLRNFFFRQIMNDRLDQVIMRAFSERWDHPPVSMEQIAPFWKNFSGHKGWFPTGQFQKIRTLHCSFYSSSASV